MNCADAMRASSQGFSGEDLPQIEGLTAIKIENFANNSANSSRSEPGSNHRRSRNNVLADTCHELHGQKIANSNFESTEVFNAIYLHATDLMKTLNNSDLLKSVHESRSREGDRMSRTEADQICEDIIKRTFDKDCG